MSTAQAPLLTVEALSFRVKAKALLEAVSFRAGAGEMIALVGPNGAGKSTLLKLLAKDLTPTQGRVELAGRPLQQWEAARAARVRAVLPQHNTLSFPFTVEEVVEMGRVPYRETRAATRQTVDWALEAAGMTNFRNRNYLTLSGGERQRVQFARVLAQVGLPDGRSVRCVLLDEPVAALDLAHQHNLLQTASGLAKAGLCVIAVLHELNLAARYAHRLLLLHKGRLVADGTPTQVLTPQRLKDVYGYPAELYQPAELSHPLVV